MRETHLYSVLGPPFLMAPTRDRRLKSTLRKSCDNSAESHDYQVITCSYMKRLPWVWPEERLGDMLT